MPSSADDLPHALDGGLAARGRIGLIVLATDQTIEHEWRLILAGSRACPPPEPDRNDPQITPETLAADGALNSGPRLPSSCRESLPRSAFGCTSAAMVIGEDRVFEHLRAARPEAKPTTPVTAAFAAFGTFGRSLSLDSLSLGAMGNRSLASQRQHVDDASALGSNPPIFAPWIRAVWQLGCRAEHAAAGFG